MSYQLSAMSHELIKPVNRPLIIIDPLDNLLNLNPSVQGTAVLVGRGAGNRRRRTEDPAFPPGWDLRFAAKRCRERGRLHGSTPEEDF